MKYIIYKSFKYLAITIHRIQPTNGEATQYNEVNVMCSNILIKLCIWKKKFPLGVKDY